MEISLEVQKFLHSPAFVAMCDEILTISDENRSGELDSTSQLVNAMNAVIYKMATDFQFECPLITDKMAEGALSDFDLDHNTAIDKEEFTQLSKTLIIASMLNYDKPHEVAKYCLATSATAEEEKPSYGPLMTGAMPSRRSV